MATFTYLCWAVNSHWLETDAGNSGEYDIPFSTVSVLTYISILSITDSGCDEGSSQQCAFNVGLGYRNMFSGFISTNEIYSFMRIIKVCKDLPHLLPQQPPLLSQSSFSCYHLFSRKSTYGFQCHNYGICYYELNSYHNQGLVIIFTCCTEHWMIQCTMWSPRKPWWVTQVMKLLSHGCLRWQSLISSLLIFAGTYVNSFFVQIKANLCSV